MLNLSECFSLVGEGNCVDVASSLGLQGVEPEMSIPVYGPFFVKIMIGEGAGFICDHLNEFSALQYLSQTCGAVHVTLNVCQMDILTLIGCTLVATPNTGGHVFIKNVLSDLVDVSEDLLAGLSEAAGIPLASAAGAPIEIANNLLRFLFEKIVDLISNDMGNFGINVHHWEELPEYIAVLKQSGEAHKMADFRKAVGAFVM